MSVTGHRLWPRLLMVAGLGLVVAPVLVWAATGREGYTRWPDAKLAASDVATPQEDADLFEDIGLATEDETHARPDIQSRFALGLLPGGLTPKHMISVASVATVGVVLGGVGVVSMRCGRRTT
jgi:hypothetical protein